MAKYREGKGHPGKRGAPVKEHKESYGYTPKNIPQGVISESKKRRYKKRGD